MRLTGLLRRPLWLVAAIGEGALEAALAVVRETRSALEVVRPEGSAPEPTGTSVDFERPVPRRRPRARPASRPARPAPSEPTRAPPAPPVPDRVKTLDDEPVPVAEFAERGAEDGAGAEIHVDAPWEGYDAMTVDALKTRLADADRESLAAVVLYEGFGRGRRSVIDAAEKRLTRLSVPGS